MSYEIYEGKPVRRKNMTGRPPQKQANARRADKRPVSPEKKKRERQAAAKRAVIQDQKQKKIRAWKIRAAVAGGCIAAVIIVYCLIAATYRSKFLPNSFVNGFDVSGLSAADTEKILKESVEDYQLEVGFRGGQNEMITSKDVDLTYVSSNEVESILAGQKRLGWLMSVFGRKAHFNVSTSFKFDSAKLRACLEGLPEFQEDSISLPRSSRVVLDGDLNYRVSDEYEGNRPDEDVIFDAVDAAINASDSRLSLDLVENAYAGPAAGKDDEALNERAEELNEFVSTELTIRYKDGTEKVLDRDDLVNWISRDENGAYYIGQEKIYIEAYNIVTAAANKYNDTKDKLEFHSTAEGVVRLSCDPYGYKIDVESETDRLVEALNNHESGVLEFNNAVKESVDATFGGTYCEVDVTAQHVYYYEDGKLVMDSDCVTGLEYDYDRRTPSGVFAVFDKETDKTLGSYSAPDPSQRYESHVNFWMPFYESYGMHDAPWRENFGGSWYREYGSHGCVNLPPYFAEELYNKIELWTPVIVLREGDGMSESSDE